MQGVRVDAVRVLDIRGGTATILVPVEAFPRAKLRDALCLLSGDGETGSMSCATTADLHRGQPGSTIPRRGLAPDGAVKVTVRVRGGRTVSATPRDNYYDVRWNGGAGTAGIAWPRYFDARGREIKF
jgi:hypothetical protein